MDLWRLVLSGTALSLLAGCWSVELSIVVALCVGVVCVMSDAVQPEAHPRAPNDTPSVSSQRAVASRAARVAANVADASQRSPSSGGRRPVVRQPLVQRVPLAALVPEMPTEDALDACVVAQQRKRNRRPDARDYHTKALPNAIRAAARELTTADPAIVPLDGPETCARPLGHT